MKSNIIKLLLIAICISDNVAANCEEVTASGETKSFVVKGSGTGCQYRVKSDSGKAVKVYVNETSGTNCVKATSGDRSETLCPKGATTVFTSTSAIDVSADSVTTTTAAATTTVTPTTTPNPIQPPSENGEGKKGSQKDPGADEKTSKEKGAEPQGDKKNGKEKSAEENGTSVEKLPQEPPIAAASRLMRQARDISTSAASNDVTVYYVLGTSSSACGGNSGAVRSCPTSTAVQV
ncbi:unnamed protein product [Echinostoma caproni]|uniref:Uncharacterized protein n=1 Tax=Echinostoma caproni TaxID=27848 RepID=A0A183B1J0_9TREM|nr:unnamed protein product [Echinostoma caproni]